MASLADAIKAKLADEKISPTAAARAVGLSLPSFRAVLKGKSTPNARSLKKYAKLLGVSPESIAAMAGSAPAKGKPGRKPKGKPGPKPGRRGRKPGRKPGRPPGRKAGIGPIVELLKQAEAIMSDDLAVAVHGLGKSQRNTVAAIIASLA